MIKWWDTDAEEREKKEREEYLKKVDKNIADFEEKLEKDPSFNFLMTMIAVFFGVLGYRLFFSDLF